MAWTLFKKPPYEYPGDSLEFEYDWVGPSRAYLKKMSLETVISFVAKSVAMSDFRISKNGKRIIDNNHYVLNVRVNTDQSAFEFWYQFVFKLLFDGQVLAFWTDTGDLLIADSFERNEYAVYPDTFNNVVVKDYEFKRTFNMDEVIYLKYGNESLSKFMDGMFSDYTELFNRIVTTNLLANQVRGVVELDTNQALDKNRREKLQEFVNSMYKAFSKGAVAIVPQLKGFNYKEIADGGQNKASIDELTKIKTSLVNEVANILSVPQALVHGEIADMDSLMKSYIKFCINPLNKMIEDELNVKIIGKSDYMNGERIKVIGIQAQSVFDLAVNGDKLVSSSIMTRNEVREEMGKDRVDNPEMDVFVLTKNYETVEGGE